MKVEARCRELDLRRFFLELSNDRIHETYIKGGNVGDLIVLERVPGERNEEYCVRAVNRARVLEKVVVVLVEEKFVEVSPDTSLNYLLGYFAGYEDGSRGRVGF